MSISNALLPEFDREMVSTRKMIERMPEDKLDWRPHEKSMSMGQLATHLAQMPGWGVETLRKESVDITGYKPPKLESVASILEMFDGFVAALHTEIAAASDEHWMKLWSLSMDGKTIFNMPRIAVIRGMILNHSIHHRAQLGVYLRLNGIPVPAVYGPSADEKE